MNARHSPSRVLSGHPTDQVAHFPADRFSSGRPELKSTWRREHDAGDRRKCTVDLIEVTLIERNGEAVLAEIMSQGAEFVARDVYTKQLLRNLPSERREEHEGKTRSPAMLDAVSRAAAPGLSPTRE